MKGKNVYKRSGWARGTRPEERDVQMDEDESETTDFSYVLKDRFDGEDSVVQFIRTLQHSLRAAHTEELELGYGFNKQLWSDLRELGWKYSGGKYLAPWRPFFKRRFEEDSVNCFQSASRIVQHLLDLGNGGKGSPSPDAGKVRPRRNRGTAPTANATTPGGSGPGPSTSRKSKQKRLRFGECAGPAKQGGQREEASTGQAEDDASRKKRKRTPTLKTVNLTPDLVKLVQNGTMSEEDARSIAVHDYESSQSQGESTPAGRTKKTSRRPGPAVEPPPWVSPLSQKIKSFSVQEANQYILLDTSAGMVGWMWRALRKLGWAHNSGKYFPPGKRPAERSQWKAGVHYFESPDEALAFVDRIRCSPYLDIDFSKSFTSYWKYLRTLGWTFEKDKNAIHMGGLKSLGQLSYYCMPRRSVENGTPGVDIFESASEAVDFIQSLVPSEDDDIGYKSPELSKSGRPIRKSRTAKPVESVKENATKEGSVQAKTGAGKKGASSSSAKPLNGKTSQAPSSFPKKKAGKKPAPAPLPAPAAGSKKPKAVSKAPSARKKGPAATSKPAVKVAEKAARPYTKKLTERDFLKRLRTRIRQFGRRSINGPKVTKAKLQRQKDAEEAAQNLKQSKAEQSDDSSDEGDQSSEEEEANSGSELDDSEGEESEDEDSDDFAEPSGAEVEEEVVQQPLITWSSRKALSTALSPFSPIAPATAPMRLPTNVAVYHPVGTVDDIPSDDDEDFGGEEDTRAEGFMLRHYWEELEEQNETISTWLTCHNCGKRRKANRAHPYLRGLKDYFYCGNGLRPTEARCGRPCTWFTSNIGQTAALMLTNHNINRVEDMLFDKGLEGHARSLGVVFEPQTLRPVMVDDFNEGVESPNSRIV
jgi:hypothetical protein